MASQGKTYSEGGRGWLVVFVACVTQFILFGNLEAAGVLITNQTEEFETKLYIIGLINSVYYGMQSSLAPLPVAISYKIGVRPVVVVGGLMIGLGFLTVSFTGSIYVFALAMIFLTGLGTACVKETTFAETALYFHEKYALASFVGKLGGPFGMMVYGPVTQLLMDFVGWRGTCMLLGVFSFNIICCGLLLPRVKAPGKNPYQPLMGTDSPEKSKDLDEEDGEDEEDEEPAACCRDVIKQSGISVFKNQRFVFLTLIKYFSGFGYSGIVIYIVPNALSLGLEPHQASFTTTAWGLGNLFGLIFAAFFIQTKILSEFAVLGIATSVAIVCYALDPYISPFIGQIGITILIGASVESVLLVPVIMTRYLATDDKFVCFFFSWQEFVTGLSYPVSGLLSGWLFDQTGNFKTTFLFYSVTMATAGVCNVIYYIYHRRSKHIEQE